MIVFLSIETFFWGRLGRYFSEPNPGAKQKEYNLMSVEMSRELTNAYQQYKAGKSGHTYTRQRGTGAVMDFKNFTQTGNVVRKVGFALSGPKELSLKPLDILQAFQTTNLPPQFVVKKAGPDAVNAFTKLLGIRANRLTRTTLAMA